MMRWARISSMSAMISSLFRRPGIRLVLSLCVLGSSELLLPSVSLHAIPNTFIGGNFIGPIVPAHPRFKSNLTRDFLSAGNWDQESFPGPWQINSKPGDASSHMTAMPVLFGAVPESVTTYSRDGKLREMVITYLDAGTFFRYKAGGEKTYQDRKIGSKLRSEFAHHYGVLSREIQQRLEKGCGQGEQTVLGRSDLLRSTHIDYRWEDFVIRLTRRASHSIELRLMRQADRIDTVIDEKIASLDRRQLGALYARNVHSNERGDTLIAGIPMSIQGFTPYCGIHSLEMASQYLGLRLRSDELAAAADFRNTGSARGSNILELYHAAAEELGMKLKVSSRFDFDKAQRSVDAGVPVIVWRRISENREKAHSAFASQLLKQPLADLPALSRSQRNDLPERSKKGSPSHASVISGINPERDEVVFTDPWGESARNRRMHADEMEATAYTVFYFEL